MEPEVDEGTLTFSRYLTYGGPWALLALVAGIVVLVLAVRAARRRAPRSRALALFAAAWLPLLPILLSGHVGETETVTVMTLRFSDASAAALCDLLRATIQWPPPLAAESISAVGLFLSLSGAVAALARSRPDAPSPA